MDENGIGEVKKQCVGMYWNNIDASTYTTFSPNMKKYIRHNDANGMNVYDFDNTLGEFSFIERILFPFDTFPSTAGVAVSPNSRFAYATAYDKVYQFDLNATDIAASKIQVASWDGTYNPYPSVFNFAALAPNGKIYISSTSSHLNLHVIHNPDSAGLACTFEQNGVDLPIYNYVTLPNIPHYKEPIVSSKHQISIQNSVFNVFPNPTNGNLIAQYIGDRIPDNYTVEIYNAIGQREMIHVLNSSISVLNLNHLEAGVKTFLLFDNQGKQVQASKVVLMPK